MLLSACLIVKNEILTLRKCLESLQDIADEIILVDTGSTDGTIEIAKEFHCKIYTYAWDNDFAAARNESLRYAKGDFILVIDADEYVDRHEKLPLREFLMKTDAEGIFIISKSYLGSLTHFTSAIPIRVMRLFRRGHLYSGAIHEQIADSVWQSGKPVVAFDLTLHHLGYTDEFLAQRSKSIRNTTLLESALSDDRSNIFQCSNLIVEYMMQRDWEKAYHLAVTTWQDIKQTAQHTWPNFTPRIVLNLMSIEWELGQREQALLTAREAIHNFPWYTDLLRRYAGFLLQNNEVARAVQVLMTCRSQGDTPPSLVESVEGSGTYLAAYDLGIAWALLGDDLNARRWFLQSFQENTAYEAAIAPIVLLAPDDPLFLYEHFETRLWTQHSYNNYAEAYVLAGFSGASEVIDRAVIAFGETEATHRARMATRLSKGYNVLRNYVETYPCEVTWLLLGVYELEHGLMEYALASLQKGGIRGQYLLHVDQTFQVNPQTTWAIAPIISELIAMRAECYVRNHIAQAIDLHAVWIQLKYSPIRHVLVQVNWIGDSVWQCEMRALRALQEHQYSVGAFWLKKARTFQSTVTQIVTACNLAWAQHDLQTVRQLLLEGTALFPESELLESLSSLVDKQDVRPHSTPSAPQ